LNVHGLVVQVCDAVDVLIVATKPQYVAPVLSENKATLSSKLVVSIAAGKTCKNLTDALGSDTARVIRVMPNTPCMVGAAAAAMCKGAPSDLLTLHAASVVSLTGIGTRRGVLYHAVRIPLSMIKVHFTKTW
jgi:pyrroline-5-carboxylate reductase